MRFYCGSSLQDAAKCHSPCPNGIEDCIDGFCYAVSKCVIHVGELPVPTKMFTAQPSSTPFVEDTVPVPKEIITAQPSSTPVVESFYCGQSLMEASQKCEFGCPTGSPTDCPGNLKCFASTSCAEKQMISTSPSHDPTGTFFCGSSFEMASACLQPCPSGTSADCPPNQVCYANTPCGEKSGFVCGTSIVNASATCDSPCPSGQDSDCPQGLACFKTKTCSSSQVEFPTSAPVTPDVEDGTQYCGYSFEHASQACTKACPYGAKQCSDGMSCYAHTSCESKEAFFCGFSWNNAASSCQFPCPSGTDEECPASTQCYAYTSCQNTNSFVCGISFDDASSSCDKPCQSGSPSQCPSGMSCFTHTTCPAETVVALPTPSPSPLYIPGDSFYCGVSFLDASSRCTSACPSRLDLECPNGETCFGSTPCPNRDTYFCGASLQEASAICEFPCPSGNSDVCPAGLSCFAFTSCADQDTFYCGTSFLDADSSCRQPCQSGISEDCPDGMSCFAHTTCMKELLVERDSSQGSHFCGASFDEATRDCSLPCPAGLDTDCPLGMTCHAHTSCNDRDSFMCGYSWDHAADTCSNPCPSGETSSCPPSMSCFAYTPCNNDGSFFCGSSFDEAASCDRPCPSGSSNDCPGGLSCFSYTSCGTGDFEPDTPTTSPKVDNYLPNDSFFCGISFDDASLSCKYPCPGGSVDCPTGLACYEYTTCVGSVPSVSPSSERDSFYCGTDLADANDKCSVPCPGGTSMECPPGESCIPFTLCDEKTVHQVIPSGVESTFYCGADKEDADNECRLPCPLGSIECPDGTACFSFSSCGESEYVPDPLQKNNTSFFCGSSFEDATLSCSVPCPSGNSAECPSNMSCYGFTSCDDRGSFFCGKSWEEASSTCSKPCVLGSNDDCDDGEACFGYTPCNLHTADIPVNSFFCGSSFADAAVTCSDPCPSGNHVDCPEGQLCHPFTPCGERESSFCGNSWADASTSCLIPCPSGTSAECPENQLCFPSTPCAEVESFFCGKTFRDANTECDIPCESGETTDCPLGYGCFAYTLCRESGAKAIPTPTLPPIPSAPPESFFCGKSYDEASTSCLHPCPSGQSAECPSNLSCFASTPCNDKSTFFCGISWDLAAASCSKPCPSGLTSDCSDEEQCFGYTPCTKSESFYCGSSFEDASSSCAIACPSSLDDECPGTSRCFKYTPCDGMALVDPDLDKPILDDSESFYCGSDFADAATKCYLPCPSGSAAECPVGEACYGNTSCHGGDSFFCGVTWYDAASNCKISCPSGLDDECPLGAKCFGYTPCTNVDAYYCGTDFIDASMSCLKPCPSGSSQECPNGLECYPNTPCDYNPVTLPSPTRAPDVFTRAPSGQPNAEVFTRAPSSQPNPGVFTRAPFGQPNSEVFTRAPSGQPNQEVFTRAPTVLVTPPPSFAPNPEVLSSLLYCGTDINTVNCLLPCPNGNECPLAHNCYATQNCADSFFCGRTFVDASETCLHACPDGEDASCPSGMSCYAQTSCDPQPYLPPDSNQPVGTFFCGKNYTDAAASCQLACPGGSSSECAVLGPEFSCFAGTSCEYRDSLYCGTSWSHAASNCLFPCPSGEDECPEGTYCFPHTSCNEKFSFMCGDSFEDASSCERPCPSGSSSECPFGESCFTHTTCQPLVPTESPSDTDLVPTESPSDTETFYPIDSYYCGISSVDASTTCMDQCPSGSDSECPVDQQCFGGTSCPTRDTYFCGTSLDDASTQCNHPCPLGRSDECPNGLTCFAFTTCADRQSYFCGNDYNDASSTCNIPCESSLSSECPGSQTCFAFTTCGDTIDTPVVSFCGSSFDDASERCEIQCGSLDDCPSGEACFHVSSCNTTEKDIPKPLVSSFYCGMSFEDASTTCDEPCPSGNNWECPSNQFCFPSTSCELHTSSYCGFSWNDAATDCSNPCPSGLSEDCPANQACFPSTPCNQGGSFFCGTTFENASSECSHPCPSGKSAQCPDGLGCYPYTMCDKIGTEGDSGHSLSPSLSPLDHFSADSYYCGVSFDDASLHCTHSCPTGLSEECPESQVCFAGTACANKESFFCGRSWDDAASTCSAPCGEDTSSICPNGEQCFGFTPCLDIDTFYCGSNFEDASSRCSSACPSGFDSDCPGSELCHKYTTCTRVTTEDTTIDYIDPPDDSFYCGLDFADASSSCSIPCPSKSSTECPVGMACFAHTTCSMEEPGTFFCGGNFFDANSTCTSQCTSGDSDDCPGDSGCFAYTNCFGPLIPLPQSEPLPEVDKLPEFSTTAPADSYFCGTSFEQASETCAHPCPPSSSFLCPVGMECHAHTTCLGTGVETYFCGVDIEDASSSCAVPCPKGLSNVCPNGRNCYAYTTCPKVAVDSALQIPADSYYCGLTYEDASDRCAFPCPERDSSLCPGFQQCYAYTPCANRESFFCGISIDDANGSCAIPCPSGRSDSCPSGESCFAYTSCIKEKELPTFNAKPSPTPAPVLSDDFFIVSPDRDSFVDPLTNDTAAPGADPLGVIRMLPLTSQPSGAPSTSLSPSSSPLRRYERKLQEEVLYSNGASSAQGGVCYPSTNQTAVRYTPPPNFSGNDACIYLARDINGAEDTAVITFLVQGNPASSPVQVSTRKPSAQLTENPSTQPTRDPSARPIKNPSAQPTRNPSAQPTRNPSAQPTRNPSTQPTRNPSAQPTTRNPSAQPTTRNPSAQPTRNPSAQPTRNPSAQPTRNPSAHPTRNPSALPTRNPSAEPTRNPSAQPTKKPSTQPTKKPSAEPTKIPTKKPTSYPTKFPTKLPTSVPTTSPIVPVTFIVPQNSFYCGVTFDHASMSCGRACSNSNGDDCPPGLTCFGNTPCGDKFSFFCGLSFDDANGRCTTQCSSGSADECPSGQSCFAYTSCDPLTESPTEMPTDTPTPRPSRKPTLLPTAKPTPPPTELPTEMPTKMPTDPPTPGPSRKPTLFPTAKPTPPPTELPTEMPTDTPAAKPKPPPIEQAKPKPPPTELPTEMPTDTPAAKPKPPPIEQAKPKPSPSEQAKPKPSPSEQADEVTPPPSLELSSVIPNSNLVINRPRDETDSPSESPVDAALVIEMRSCKDPLAMTVKQAYWRSWSSNMPDTCNRFEASDIEASSYTHLVYSFASISADGHLEPWVGSWDEVEKYQDFNRIKLSNPGIKTIIAATEGVFYGAGMNPVTFTEVAKTDESRISFANSVVTFLELYQFDGLDIDWKSPLDPDKGGKPENYERFVLLVKEIRKVLNSAGRDYILTVALPPTSWEIYDYDVEGLSPFVDWFNLMAFDYHTPKNIPKTVGAHSDLKLIDSVVFDLLEKNASTKFVLGLAAFGRTYSLVDERCREIGCPFRSPGLGGCGNTPGFMPHNEIIELLDSGSYDALHQDMSSSSMVAVVNTNQMISFDDENTWAIKTAYAEMMCLRGTMLWSIDMQMPPSSRSKGRGLTFTDANDVKSPSPSGTISCSICTGENVMDSKATAKFRGTTVACGDANLVLANQEIEGSHVCVASQAALSSECCRQECSLCGVKQLKWEEMVKYNDQITSCSELHSISNMATIWEDSVLCGGMRDTYSDLCCYSVPETPCKLCGFGTSLDLHAFVRSGSSTLQCSHVSAKLAQRVEHHADTCVNAQTEFSVTCCLAEHEGELPMQA